MIWLIHQLVKGTVTGIRVLFIGPDSFQLGSKKAAQDTATIPYGNRPPYQQFAYGQVIVRAWRNWNSRGELYFNLDFVRDLGKGRTAKSFRPQDLDDVERCVYKVRAWLRDGT